MPQKHRMLFPSAVHVLMIKDQHVLLLRRENTGYMDGAYSVPAGHLDGGETVHAAAIREVQEEVGVDLDPARLTIVHVMHRRSDQERIDWFLTADLWAGQVVNAEPQFCAEIRWFPFEGLPDDVIPYVRKGIHHVLQGMAFSSFGFDEDEESTSLSTL